MPASHPMEMLASAQARVREARSLMLRPRGFDLDKCITLLRDAEGYMEWLRDYLGRSGERVFGLRAALQALARDIRQAGVLLDRAARQGGRWLLKLQAGGGYTPRGEPAPLQPRGRITVLG